MNNLQPNETLLTGQWTIHDGRMHRDATCERIEWLVSRYLQKIADSPRSGAWETLYRDPHDGRLWERTYPQGEMQGGGPPQLRHLEANEAKRKYGVDLTDP